MSSTGWNTSQRTVFPSIFFFQLAPTWIRQTAANSRHITPVIKWPNLSAPIPEAVVIRTYAIGTPTAKGTHLARPNQGTHKITLQVIAESDQRMDCLFVLFGNWGFQFNYSFFTKISIYYKWSLLFPIIFVVSNFFFEWTFIFLKLIKIKINLISFIKKTENKKK